MASSWPFEIWSSCNFSGHITTWNCTFCLKVMVKLSGTVCQISRFVTVCQILKVITADSRPFCIWSSWNWPVRDVSLLKPHILFHSNGLDMWHVFSDIRHIKVMSDGWSFRIWSIFPYLKPHILFHSNILAIRHGFPDIRHIKVMSDDRRHVTYFKAGIKKRQKCIKTTKSEFLFWRRDS